MKNIAKSIRTTLALLLVCALSVGMVACVPEATNTQVAIDLSASAYSIIGGVSDESIVFAVSVTNSENKDYTLTTDHDELVKLENNKLTVIADTDKNVSVTVTAISKADENVKASKVITVKANVAPVLEDVTVSVKTVKPDNTKKESRVLRPGGALKLEVEVTTTVGDDNGYTVEIGNPDLIAYDETTGYLTVTGSVSAATDVTVTVVPNANPAAKKSTTINVKSESIEAQSGKLTSGMIRAIANDNITVSGSFTDVYMATKTTYDYTIKMSRTLDADGDTVAAAWSGSWNKHGDAKNVQSVIYKLGGNDTVLEAYVNKNNVAATKVMKDSDSVPLKWSSQHYWNHLEDIANQVTKFKYDDDMEAYRYDAEYGTYQLDKNTWTNYYVPSADDYLLKYISWSMNPAVEEQFYDFYVYLNAEETAIDRIEANTYPNPIYETDGDGNATETIIGYYYTTATMYFTGIGTTEVADPAPYVIDKSNAMVAGMYDVLGEAIEKAKTMDSYAFKTVENNLYSPSLDPNDYDISGSTGESTGSTGGSTGTQGVYDGKIKPYYYRSTSGDIGYLGVVTSDAILINKTTKYEYGMDDYLYRTDPYGYKQNSDGTYDVFEYSLDIKALKGKQKKTGNIRSLMPDFDVVPEIFEFYSMTGNMTDGFKYTFSLRDSAIISDVAYALTLGDFARYAVGSTGTAFLVTVDEKTKTISNVKFAYDIIGIYGGAYETIYTNVGTATLPEGTFDKYVARVIPQSWSDYTSVQTYVPAGKNEDGTTKFDSATLGGQAALEGLFGADIAARVPAPGIFSEIFDDNLSGPWGNYTRVGTDKDGNETIRYTLQLNASSDNYDENSKITDLKEKMDAISLALAQLGYKVDHGNSEGTMNSGKYIVVFENEGAGLQIKIENNNTRFFWITFYKYGEYKASK